jgi:hypothetical protein
MVHAVGMCLRPLKKSTVFLRWSVCDFGGDSQPHKSKNLWNL